LGNDDVQSVDQIDSEFLTPVARKLLGDDSAEVTGFEVISDPFEFPRFGGKEFYDIPFTYEGRDGAGSDHVILRVMPEMDAVMMLTGDTEHRELKAFRDGLFGEIPETFHTPYVHVIDRPDRGQYWAFLEDVRPQMAALGMHEKAPDDVVAGIMRHLAAFHAKFWERSEVIDRPYLMSLERPVDYFYRCVVDIMNGMKSPAESSVYVTERWPWLVEGVVNMLADLPPETRRVVEKLYRDPHVLLEEVNQYPKTLCHYDFDNRNLGIEKGRTVVIDWEILGRGMAASDVVRFMVYQQPADLEGAVGVYLDELDRQLGTRVNRDDFWRAYELGAVAEWQIRGVLFGVMVNAPSAPVPDEHRPLMRERVFADIGYVESMVKKHGLA
jgi:hypothetical protein